MAETATNVYVHSSGRKICGHNQRAPALGIQNSMYSSKIGDMYSFHTELLCFSRNLTFN